MRNYIKQMTKAIPNIIQLGQMDEMVDHPHSLDFYGYYEARGWRNFWHRFKLLIKLARHGN